MDKTKAKAYPVGSYLLVPADLGHTMGADVDTIIYYRYSPGPVEDTPRWRDAPPLELQATPAPEQKLTEECKNREAGMFLPGVPDEFSSPLHLIC